MSFDDRPWEPEYCGSCGRRTSPLSLGSDMSEWTLLVPLFDFSFRSCFKSLLRFQSESACLDRSLSYSSTFAALWLEAVA